VCSSGSRPQGRRREPRKRIDFWAPSGSDRSLGRAFFGVDSWPHGSPRDRFTQRCTQPADCFHKNCALAERPFGPQASAQLFEQRRSPSAPRLAGRESPCARSAISFLPQYFPGHHVLQDFVARDRSTYENRAHGFFQEFARTRACRSPPSANAPAFESLAQGPAEILAFDPRIRSVDVPIPGSRWSGFEIEARFDDVVTAGKTNCAWPRGTLASTAHSSPGDGMHEPTVALGGRPRISTTVCAFQLVGLNIAQFVDAIRRQLARILPSQRHGWPIWRPTRFKSCASRRPSTLPKAFLTFAAHHLGDVPSRRRVFFLLGREVVQLAAQRAAPAARTSASISPVCERCRLSKLSLRRDSGLDARRSSKAFFATDDF